MKYNYVSKERTKYGLKHIPQVLRHYRTKKPIGDLSISDLYLRDFKFMSMLRRVQSLEGKFEHDGGIVEIIEVHDTGEVFRSYFECHMIPKGWETGVTLSGVRKTNY